ncbi:large ribosomal subunit protein eL27-like [Erinaceus europaeus]|uniref:Large ribosomal subunit protein eL27-like n=1 Tax=Erinaceus europaeus TaxID=9365 RepID=A0ABM3YBI1_ERIEU|nr:large ribosomal subunit protein eL27-like [Erinaceus europaeus]
MGKFMKPRMVVLVLAIVKNTDDDTSDYPYSHALVAGIDRYPCKVTAVMSEKKIYTGSKIQSSVKVLLQGSKIKSFATAFNYHPFTRYSVHIPVDKTVANKDVFRDPALKSKAHQR